jgi:hypothetical protein
MSPPYPGMWIKAWALINRKSIGVFVVGTKTENLSAIEKFIKRVRGYLLT